MKIAVIGTGYVGLVSGVCYAELGHEVVCVDNDSAKIEKLRRGIIPIYEPGLEEMCANLVLDGRLAFSESLQDAVEEAELVVIAVGTPPKENGEADMRYIEAVAAELGDHMNGYKVVCVKSTVPVGTNERVRELIAARYFGPFDVASLPEFLREGTAVHDTMNPDRVVIGSDSERAIALLKELHAPLTPNLFVTDIRSSEMIKYASNAFLATKISFINEIANICEKVGADVDDVAKGIGMDRRIGPSFLRAGIGYGGSCFPKDTKALIQIAGNVKYDFKLLKAVVEVNRHQRFSVIDKLEDALGSLDGMSIGVWGLAFKPDTDDVRESPAIEIVGKLIERGAKPRVYDPVAMDAFRRGHDHPAITWCGSALEAARGCEALCLLTEWREFAEADLLALEEAMNRPILVDGRNLFGGERIGSTGFSYYPVGRPVIRREKHLVRELN